MTKKKKDGRGGAKPGAGRPKILDEERVTVSFQGNKSDFDYLVRTLGIKGLRNRLYDELNVMQIEERAKELERDFPS